MKKYQIIYADPPWKAPTRECIAKKSCINDKNSYHYSPMETIDICNFPIRKITDKNCLLFLWIRSPMIKEGILTGETWGFRLRTIAFIWNKQRTNPGHYTMSQCEVCLVFKKGKIPMPRGARNVKQFLSELRREHSRKPCQFRTRIRMMFPSQDKIELFAREKTSGWDVWGNEVESDINLEDL